MHFLKTVIAEGHLRVAATDRAYEAARASQAALWALKEAALVARVAAVAHELDLAQGTLRARSLLEACLWRIAKGCEQLRALALPTSLSGAATALLDGCTYPALVASWGLPLWRMGQSLPLGWRGRAGSAAPSAGSCAR